MGAQRVLQAAVGLIAVAVSVGIAPAFGENPTGERVAIVDRGPDDATVRRTIVVALEAAGLVPVVDRDVTAALAGDLAGTASDAPALSGALQSAQRAFGALDCAAARVGAREAIGIAAARQAGGVPVPELARAVTYELLCADRLGDADAAIHAAARLRSIGGSKDVPADVWAKYPEVDAMLDRDMVPVSIVSDVDGAEVWIDFARAGRTPLSISLAAGPHVIAVAYGTRRGWAAGTAVRTQPTIRVPMVDQAGRYDALARRIRAWGRTVSDAEVGAVLDTIGARVLIIRAGDELEVWGRAGRGEAVRRLGGDQSRGPIAETGRLARLIGDRVRAWSDRAPDPDLPLLVEERPSNKRSGGRGEIEDEPTRWWVYAAIAGALAVAGGVTYLSSDRGDIQRVELTHP